MSSEISWIKNKYSGICYLSADEDVAVERGDLVESGEK
jgi:hypothetical protein